jgi:hypothetical protein
VGEHVDPEVGQQRLGAGAGRHPGRRLPRRGPLEHVTGVVEAVLLHAGEVGVAGRGWVSGAFVAPGADDISSCHLSERCHSLLPMTMATGEPSVRPWRIPRAA